MASGPPSSMRSTSLIFYQSPPVEPQIEDGDVVVTRGPYTIHPRLPSEILAIMCGDGLKTLCDLKEVSLNNLLDSMGSDSCLLQKTHMLLRSLSGIKHPLTDKAVDLASWLKGVVEGLSNACSESFRHEIIVELNNCLKELLEMTSEIMVLMGKQLLENRRQELKQQTTRR